MFYVLIKAAQVDMAAKHTAEIQDLNASHQIELEATKRAAATDKEKAAVLFVHALC